MKELDVDEQAYLKGNQKKASSKKVLDKSEKPWWLRSTTYTENDLFKSKLHAADEMALSRVKNEAKLKEMGSVFDPFSAEFINSTFTDVELTAEDLKANAGKERKMLWSKPILSIDFLALFK